MSTDSSDLESLQQDELARKRNLNSSEPSIQQRLDSGTNLRRVVAGNPNTPRQVLQRLASDDCAVVRKLVAENPRSHAELLAKLSKDLNGDVRIAVVENPNSPTKLLADLSVDADADVRYAVAENPRISEEVLIALSKDDNPYIRIRAVKTLQMLAPDLESRLIILLRQNVDGLL